MTATAIESPARVLNNRLDEISCQTLDEKRNSFGAVGVVSIQEFLAPETIDFVRSSIRRSIDRRAQRRDLSVEQTGDSPRRMSNVRMADIAESEPKILEIYEDVQLMGLLSYIAGQEVLACPYEPERFLITKLEKEGDTQGWHLDDYTIALMWIDEAPDASGGGFLQIAQHPGRGESLREKPISEILAHSTIVPYPCKPGDVYIIDSRINLHRVYPVKAGQTRTALNMTFATAGDLNVEHDHTSIQLLWSER